MEETVLEVLVTLAAVAGIIAAIPTIEHYRQAAARSGDGAGHNGTGVDRRRLDVPGLESEDVLGSPGAPARLPIR
jgi:hypothetical protein